MAEGKQNINQDAARLERESRITNFLDDYNRLVQKYRIQLVAEVAPAIKLKELPEEVQQPKEVQQDARSIDNPK